LKEDRRRPTVDGAQALLSPLEKQLDSLSAVGVWRVLVLSILCIAGAGYLIHPTNIHLGPLYLLPICLASWRLSFRVGLAVAVIGAVLSLGTCTVATGELPAGAAGNLALQTFSLAITAAIVSRFRASYERERIFARRDGITGALTRPAFEQQADAMIAAAAIQGRPLLLAYLDLDGFKSVNDRHGHEAGDLVLKHFGIEGRAALRREDCFGRMGGDEFALLVLLPAIEEAQETAEGLHRRFTAALALTAHEVTCSMGAVAIPPDRGADLDELLREADRLMYAAKRAGKAGLRFSATAPPLSVSSLPTLHPPFGEASEVAGAG
jgi:diguanylate cyclase (GGDEF)-like protein